MIDLTKVDCRLAVCDDPVDNRPVKITCMRPGHRDSEESMAVYPDHIHCYGCQFHVSRRIDSLYYLLTGDDTFARVIDLLRDQEKLAKYTSEQAGVCRQVANTPLPRSLVQVYKEVLWGIRKDRLQPLLDRGLSSEIILQADLGHTGRRWSIPVYDVSGQLVNIRSRRDLDDGPKYTGYAGRNGMYLYPASWIAGARHLAVVEGELDALRLWQEGIPAVSITNGAGNLRRIPSLLQDSKPALTIIGDMDAPGRLAARETRQAAIDLGFCVDMFEWPAWRGKDVTEYLANGYSLPAGVRNAS
jgi:hypothetical protein